MRSRANPLLPLDLPRAAKARGGARGYQTVITTSVEPVQFDLFGPVLSQVGPSCFPANIEYIQPFLLRNTEKSFSIDSNDDLIVKKGIEENLGDLVQFERYVRRCKMGYLDRHFPSWVARIPKLRRLSYELMHQDKHWLGDVVRMTEEELILTTKATPRVVEILKADLATVGLQLGMHTWGWHPTKSPFIERFEPTGRPPAR